MKNKDAFITTFPLMWIYTAVVAGILYLIFGLNVTLSFILGSVTILMGMSMLYKSSNKLLSSDTKHVNKLSVLNYAVRFLLYALVLVVSGLLENLEILATAFGLISFKIVLYFNLIVLKRGEKL